MKRDTILVVDDVEVNRFILCEVFKSDYRMIEAENGEEALEFIKKESERLAVILLDVVMPIVNGYGVLEKISAEGYMNKIPVVLITGDELAKHEIKGYDFGVSDIISKPFDVNIVKKRVDNIIELFQHKNNLEELVKEQTEKIEMQSRIISDINNQIIETLSSLVEFRNLESGQHIRRIKLFTKILLKYVSEFYEEYDLTPKKIEKITSAAAIHDIGKIAIPDVILLKPARLTAEEFEIMKSHTTRGREMIKTLSFIGDDEFFEYCYDICSYHHERYDGKGYPYGLVGDAIPIAAQIVSIADVYDALVSARVYKNAYKKEEAYHMILDGECGTFSPKMMECFMAARVDFELASDELISKT